MIRPNDIKGKQLRLTQPPTASAFNTVLRQLQQILRDELEP